MPSNYPSGLDSLPTDLDNETVSEDVHPALHYNANDAINKVEAELGPNPSGNFSTVALRLAARPISIEAYGGILDGRDVGAAINSAVSDSVTAGGGVVELGGGLGMLEQAVTLRSGVYLTGEGEEATILRGKSGTTHDLFKTQGFDALVGTNTNDGQYNWGLEKLTIDGNKTARTAGRGVAIYGKAYRLMHFIVRNTPGLGMFSEWYSGGDEMECQISHFKFHRCKGGGMHFRGPHDSTIMDGQVIAAGHGGTPGTVHSIFVDSGNAAGTQFIGVHNWGTEHKRAWYVTTSGTQLVACQGEGATEAQLFLDAQDAIVMGGHFFGLGDGDTSTALIVGDTATGGYPSRNLVQTKLSNADKLVDFRREGGRSVYRLVGIPITGGELIVGTPADTDLVELMVDSETPIEDASHQSSGIVVHRLPNLDNAAQVVRASDGVNLVEFDTQADPTIKFRGMWYEAVDYAGDPSWEISPDGAAIFTKARPIALDEGGITLTEGSDLAAGLNEAVLFARDNGAGKTQLVAQFATGISQLALEGGTPPATATARVTSLPGSPTDGQEIYYVAGSSLWHLRYNSALGGSYKWEFLGGAPLHDEIWTAESSHFPGAGVWMSSSVPANDPEITVPLAGDYDVDHAAVCNVSAGPVSMHLGVKIGATEPVIGTNSVHGSAGLTQLQQRRRITVPVALTLLKQRYYEVTSGAFTRHEAWMSVTPVRVG